MSWNFFEGSVGMILGFHLKVMLCSVPIRKPIETISLFFWLHACDAFVEDEECLDHDTRHKYNFLFCTISRQVKDKPVLVLATVES